MSDLFLDPKTHDLVIQSGDLILLETESTLVKQRLKQRLLTIQGEWFLDESIGLPYFREINQKGIDEGRIRSLFLREIKRTEGIQEIEELIFDFDNVLRKLFIFFRVTLVDGPPVNMELTL